MFVHVCSRVTAEQRHTLRRLSQPEQPQPRTADESERLERDRADRGGRKQVRLHAVYGPCMTSMTIVRRDKYGGNGF